MDDRLQYASMLGIPVNTCSVTVKQGKSKAKKRKKVDSEQVKQQLVDKVNMLSETSSEQAEEKELSSETQPTTNIITKPSDSTRKFKFNAIAVQVVIIIALITTIFVTNSVYPNSGINVFMRAVFGQNASQEDLREYTDFTPTLSNGTVTFSDGVINVKHQGSVYSSVDGRVESVELDQNGKYTMQIRHSKNFVSVFSGIDYAYCQTGDLVYGTIPVGYVKEQMNLCFLGGDGAVIVNYTIVDDAVVWAV